MIDDRNAPGPLAWLPYTLIGIAVVIFFIWTHV
jgi:hypothetical protein